MADTSIPERWAKAWSANPPDDSAASTWRSLYSPTSTYTDHAFQIIRQGTNTPRRRFELWRTANPDFVMIIAESMPVEKLDHGRTRYSVQTHNSGTFVEDLPSRKAVGKKFYFRGVVDLVLNEDGLIEGVEEWYCSNFDATEGLERYNFRNDETS